MNQRQKYCSGLQGSIGKTAKHMEALRLRVREYKEHLAATKREARQSARTLRTFEVGVRSLQQMRENYCTPLGGGHRLNCPFA